MYTTGVFRTKEEAEFTLAERQLPGRVAPVVITMSEVSAEEASSDRRWMHRVADLGWGKDLHKTTTAEASSIALSPPKAISAGLLALRAAKRDTAASTLIQARLSACTIRIRWKVAGAIA
jgi:hypothetical protein